MTAGGFAEDPPVHRLAAFTSDPSPSSSAAVGAVGGPSSSAAVGAIDLGGNPAGVVITDDPLDPSDMQRIAAEVGYSETAFLSPVGEPEQRRFRMRYFSPSREVTFCGHATVAAGVLLGQRRGEGRYAMDTLEGPVPVQVSRDAAGAYQATLTSVPPTAAPAEGSLVDGVLRALAWPTGALDPRFEPAIAYAGARHLILVVAERATLAALDYAYDDLAGLMDEADLTTVALLWQESETRYHARNVAPAIGVVEDPATGAAAAAFGGYLRHLGVIDPPVTIEITQGVDMGRPSLLTVHIPPGNAGIDVAGGAVTLPD